MSKKLLKNRFHRCARLIAMFAFLWVSMIYDVKASDFTATGNLNVSRNDHSVTLLHNGKVLVAGGTSNAGSLNSAEIYDLGTATFSLTTGSMISSRSSHTATLLPDGKVLFTGGISNGSYLDTAEIYDPDTGSFSSTGTMAVPRSYHTATLLRNGKVLLAGGYNSTGHIRTAEEYDPTTGSFTLVSSNLITPRSLHTATLMDNGMVMMIGGAGGMSNTEIYDPETSRFMSSVNINIARELHTATLLPSGQILVVGGSNASGFVGGAEIFDPSTNSIEQTGILIVPRNRHTATLRPDGKVVIIGGYNGSAITIHEIYDASSGVFTQTEGALLGGRYQHSSSLLPDGKILSVGGIGATGNPLVSAEIYTAPVDGLVTPTGSTLPYDWIYGKPSATLLPDGTVLVIGGLTGYNGQLYDPVTGTFTGVDRFVDNRRSDHTATLLANGKVLVVGGRPEQFGYAPYVYSDSYLYDPTTRTFHFAANILNPRRSHRAFLLPDGRVLITGGYNTYYDCNNNLYDPYHNGCPPPVLASEVYDPSTNTFSLASDEIVGHAVSAIPYGIVNNHHTNTLLLDGIVLNAGCSNNYSCTSDTEIFTPGFYQRPQISTIAIDGNHRVVITGVGFKSSSEASGGSYSNSATNFPILQLRDFDNSPPIYIPAISWDNNNYISSSINGLPIGYYQASIVTNGIPSLSSVIRIKPQILVSPGSLQLRTSFNGSSSLYPVTISNNGTGDLRIVEINFPTNDASFVAGPGGTCSPGKVLPPAESCIVNVVYNPINTGIIHATIVVKSNDPDLPHKSIPLNASNYLANLSFLGNCTGRVEISSSLEEAVCNYDCIKNFSTDTLLVFNSKPDRYCAFSGWGGMCSGETCVIQANMNFNITTTYATGNIQLNQNNNSTWYTSFSNGLINVYTDSELLVRSGNMDEALNINTNTSVIMRGGYDPTFSTIVGETLIGTLIINRGILIIDKISIK